MTCSGMNKVIHPRANICFPACVGLLPVCAVHMCVRVHVCVRECTLQEWEGVCSRRWQMEYVRMDGCPRVFIPPSLVAEPTIFS